jgi:hypothetical protein
MIASCRLRMRSLSKLKATKIMNKKEGQLEAPAKGSWMIYILWAYLAALLGLVAGLSGAKGQSLSRNRVSVAAAGTSSTIRNGNMNWLVQQSVGQSIRHSTGTTGPLIVRQGFAQPPGYGFKPTKPNRILKAEVFPNPNAGQLSIRFGEPMPGKTLLKLFTLLGQEAFQIVLNQNPLQTLLLPQLPAGTYILTLTCLEKTFTTRIIKLNP